jgi:hypothetical protein
MIAPNEPIDEGLRFTSEGEPVLLEFLLNLGVGPASLHRLDRVDECNHFLMGATSTRSLRRGAPSLLDQGRPVASAGSAVFVVMLAICISQYFNARFARSAHDDVWSCSR